MSREENSNSIINTIIRLATTALPTLPKETETEATKSITALSIPKPPPSLMPVEKFITYFDELKKYFEFNLDEAVVAFPPYMANPKNFETAAFAKYSMAMLNLQYLEIGYTIGREVLAANMEVLAYTTKKADEDTTFIQTLIDKMTSNMKNAQNEALAAQGMLGDRHTLYNQYMAHNLVLILVVMAAAFLYYQNDTPRMDDLKDNWWLKIPIGISSLSIMWYILLKVVNFIKSIFL
jgi:hypothetical protein